MPPWQPDKPAAKSARQAWIRALEAISPMADNPHLTLPGLIDDLADQHGNRPALLGEGESLSYRQLADHIRRIASWAQPGVVALLMPNRPMYAAIWLGLTRAGGVVALINTNLRSDALLHSLNAAAATRLIVDTTLLPAVRAIADRLPPGLTVFVHGTAETPWQNFTPPDDTSPLSLPLPTQSDRALLIFTSGTTGLPKAAVITHGRVLEWSLWFAGLTDARPTDRMYDCLPMYHSVGGIVAIGAMLTRGASVLIRARFSASHFWNDIAEGRCTIFQYIGELCRFLASAPPHPQERSSTLRLACGNGLQADIWPVLRERFAIAHILEFYAATEGSVSLYNCEERPGSIGRIPPFLADRFPVALVQVDPLDFTPLRTEHGLCIPCAPDQPGEALGRVSPTRRFDGYTDAAASAAKLIRNVLTPGDVWFRTGDLMRKDAEGFFFFVDRIGDTFRWKGENVATTEVAAVLLGCPGVLEAVVYGVTIPGHEGRAGMAALSTTEAFDLNALHRHLSENLPDYAQPLFLRMANTLEATGTFKPIKSRLIAESYTESPEPVWFKDRTAGHYRPCDATCIAEIEAGLKL